MHFELNSLRTFLSGKKILIAGFGREGQSTFRFLRQHVVDVTVVVADKNRILWPEEFSADAVELCIGDEYLAFDESFDFMMRSPGISLMDIPTAWIEQGKVLSQTDLLLQFFGSRVIGITGTKGKSTTTTLVHHILTQCGHEAILAGNMGLPFFDQLAECENKWIVAELSSHQLETAKASPAISVLLNIFPEHLDHYRSFDEYAAAKWNIARYQSHEQVCFISQTLANSFWSTQRSVCSGRIMVFGQSEIKVSGTMIQQNSFAYFDGKRMNPISLDATRIPLRGEHNLANISAALGAAIEAGVPAEQAVEAMYSFQSLPHRLEFVRTVNDITFINDSISTIPESAIAALKAFPETETIILGGFDRGIDYAPLVAFIPKTGIQQLILMGDVGRKVMALLNQKKAVVKTTSVQTLEEAVEAAYASTSAGKVCLLSPAASSYDQFKNFEHRGNEFKKFVNNLK